ncbi:MAG TPA: MBL fold metallo-hydrolase [Xanthobacteraceae bacterium]|jgi:glyoxylase-like metal-dependent hydrolase (beta-lactamase superfamily II)
MKRVVLLFVVLTIAIGSSAAQAPSAAEDHTVEVAPGLYNVTWGNNWGNMGLNVGVSVGDDGLLLIDAQDEPDVPRLIGRIAQISPKPVRYVINTHWHSDHVGGNAAFARQGALIIAQENTRTRMMTDQPNPLGGRAQRAFAAGFWPTVTFRDQLNLHVNGDEIEVLHVPNAHTDADAIVFFRKADVLFAADLFNNTDYTRVDLRGGSLDGMIAAYDKLLPGLDDKVKVVPGRGPVGAKKDLIDYRQVMVTLRGRIAEFIKSGKTLEETIALKPTREFDARWANGPVRPDQLVEEIYADLRRTVH